MFFFFFGWEVGIIGKLYVLCVPFVFDMVYCFGLDSGILGVDDTSYTLGDTYS